MKTIKNEKEMTEKVEKKKTQEELETEARGWDFFNHYWVDNMSIFWRFKIDSNWDYIYIEKFRNDEVGQLKSISNEKYSIDNQTALLNIALNQGGYVNGNSILTHHTVSVKLNRQEEQLILKRGKQVEDDEIIPLV